jgi:TPR repeat protein
MSAKQGDIESSLILSHMYRAGEKVQQNYMKGLKYLKLATDHNNDIMGLTLSFKLKLGDLPNRVNQLKQENKEYKRELDTMRLEIERLKCEIIDLKYRPNGIGYQEAHAHFESLNQ